MVAVLYYCLHVGSTGPAPGSPEILFPPAAAYYLEDLGGFPAHQRLADFDEYDDTIVEPGELQLLIDEHTSLRARIDARDLPTPPSWIPHEWRGSWRELATFHPADDREARSRWDCVEFGWKGLTRLVDDIHMLAKAGLQKGLPVIIAGD